MGGTEVRAVTTRVTHAAAVDRTKRPCSGTSNPLPGPTNMNSPPSDTSPTEAVAHTRTPSASTAYPQVPERLACVCIDAAPHVHVDPVTRGSSSSAEGGNRAVPRGLSSRVSTSRLRERSWLVALMVCNRFRVIRTLDIAAACYPERPFKAALTAAQRVVRGLVKQALLQRYKTARFQTVYGLTQRGVDWLAEAGIDAHASVRRVSDMTNPEHRLWAQFLVLCCERRGLQAMSETELLTRLNRDVPPGSAMKASLLTTSAIDRGRRRTISWRPDAVAVDADGIGLTAIEVDCSARGSLRAASLGAQVMCIGRTAATGHVLRRVVVWCRTDRIRHRVLATLNALVRETSEHSLTTGRRQLKPSTVEGEYELWTSMEVPAGDQRFILRDVLAGHVIVQHLPTWLPKVRIDARNLHSTAGWFDENFLPWRRPVSDGAWLSPTSPLDGLRSA